MHYQLSRNGQTYGPYTLDDLQRYLASGNVLPTDLAKSDEMSDWLPVSQLLATSAATPAAAPPASAAPAYAAPAYAAPAMQTQAYVDPAYHPVAVNPALASSQFPDAPNLHWGLVLLFSFLTCFLFTFIWDIVIAAWLKRVQPGDKSLFWYLGALGVQVVKWISGMVLLGFVLGHHGHHVNYMDSQFGGLAALNKLLSLTVVGLTIAANFVKRASLEQHFNGPEPVGLRLDPVMTFFFAPWYFQYHLNRINAMKNAARYGAARAF